MSGLLGGLLKLIHLIGGTVLFVLIGRKAWRDSDNGYALRSVAGIVIVAVGIGFILYGFIVPDKPTDPPARPTISFCIAPVVVGLFLALLEFINSKFDD
jgi:hypothetical protein